MLEELYETKQNHAFVVESSDSEEELECLSEIKRKKGELDRALHCIGIKPSTFTALLNGQKTDEIEELLRESMIARTQEFQHRPLLGNHLDIPEKHGLKSRPKTDREYDPHIDTSADLPTMHEAFQFLMKKYVEDPKLRKDRLNKAKNVSTAVSAFADGIECEAQSEQSEEKRKKRKEKKSESERRNTLDVPDLEESSRRSSIVLDQFSDLMIDDPFLDGSRSSGKSSKASSRRGSQRGLTPSSSFGASDKRRSSYALDPKKRENSFEKDNKRRACSFKL